MLNQNTTTSTTRLYKCPVCKDTGIEFISGDEYMELHPEYKTYYKEIYGDKKVKLADFGISCRRCNGYDNARTEQVRTTAEIPASFYDKRLCDFKFDIYMDAEGRKVDMSKSEKLLKSFINDFEEWEKRGKGFYIYSKTKGSGKTYLASCLCNSLIDMRRIGTRFVSASQLLELSKNSDGSGDSLRNPIGLLQNCKLLVIDDLGAKRNGQDWLNDVLFQIIDRRYQNKLVTIITSNVMPGELDFDERTVDRINAMCLGMKLPEMSVRSRKAARDNKEFLEEMGLL